MNTNFISAVFIGLCLYNMGNMMALQMQHFSLYPLIEPANFLKYIQGNNKAAVLPAIVPAMICLLLSAYLVFAKNDVIPNWFFITGLITNIIVLVSTIVWQGKLQGQMAVTGFDIQKINVLIVTNWIRTMAYALQGILSIIIIARLIK